jgi:hypothetical protein
MDEMNQGPQEGQNPPDQAGPEQQAGASSSRDEQPAPEGPAGVQQGGAAKEANKDARMWAMFCHLGGLAIFVIPLVGNIVAPLIIWQIKKDDFPFVDEQGKEALNFQISMAIYLLISAVLSFVCIGVFLFVAVGIVDLVFLLIAAVKANDGVHYRYPLTMRFVK